jgi:lipopolysaccharide/colanic/teichoic acid biosynthesis glycosyltransferase
LSENRATFLREVFTAGKAGSRGVAGALALVALVLAVATGVGLAGPLGVVAALCLFIVVGSVMELQKRRHLREIAFVGRDPLPYLDPIEDFGIHPWVGGGAESELPPFVERRAMSSLLDGLARKRFVILTGPDESGKSRLAYEAALKSSQIALVARSAPRQGDDPLIQLMNDRRGFMAMQEDQILFLTDLGVRLSAGAISGESIRVWLDRNPRISVIATLASDDLDVIEESGRSVVDEMRKLKRAAAVVPVLGRLVREELDEAGEKFPQLDRSQLQTLTKFLAAGPPLHGILEVAKEERPLGYHIVCAVADWRRAGIRRPAPLAFVREVAQGLAGDEGDDFTAELAWALEDRESSAALIYEVEVGDEVGYVPDNIVAGLFDHQWSGREIKRSTWEAIQKAIETGVGTSSLSPTQVADDLLAIGQAALAYEQPVVAYRALAAVSDFGDPTQQRRAVDLVTSDREAPLINSRRGDGIIQRLKPVKTLAEGRRFKSGKPLLGSDSSEDGWVFPWIYRRNTIRNFLRVVVLGVVDVLSTGVGLFVGLGIRARLAGEAAPIPPDTGVTGAFIALWAAVTIFVFASARLYRKEVPRARIAGIAAAVLAFATFGFVTTVAEGFNVLDALLAAVGGGFWAFALDFVFRFAYDEVSRKWVWNHGLETRTLLFGSPAKAAAVERALRDMSRPSDVIGYLADVDVEEDFEILPVAPLLGNSDDLALVAARHGVGRVIIADPTMEPAQRQRLADRCHGLGLAVEAVASNADIRGGSGSYLLGQPLILMPLLPLWQRNTWFFIKRMLDVIIALALLVLLSPFLLLVALLVRLEGKPVLVHTWRPGLGGESFHMYRFRTGIGEHRSRMNLLDEEDTMTVERTKFGTFLRSHGIDELPQLINVLRGHMSLVGPRPLELNNHVRLSDLDLLRYVVRPGATSPWQVCSRTSLTYSELTAMDMAYLRRWSVFIDLEILLRTTRLVIFGRGEGVPAIERGPLDDWASDDDPATGEFPIEDHGGRAPGRED